MSTKGRNRQFHRRRQRRILNGAVRIADGAGLPKDISGRRLARHGYGCGVGRDDFRVTEADNG